MEERAEYTVGDKTCWRGRRWREDHGLGRQDRVFRHYQPIMLMDGSDRGFIQGVALILSAFALAISIVTAILHFKSDTSALTKRDIRFTLKVESDKKREDAAEEATAPTGEIQPLQLTE